MRFVIAFFLIVSILSCKEEVRSPSEAEKNKDPLEIKYAEGFRLYEIDQVTFIEISNPWPGSDKKYKYLLPSENHSSDLTNSDCDAIVNTPLNRLVVTSTTHIPSLDMLGVTGKLVGFPNLEYISSENARRFIDDGKIKELGKNESINTEVLIDLQPDAVVTFAVDGTNKTVASIQEAGIPVLYNADWTEKHPLGKAEWIKFFGVLFDKQEAADSIFGEIEAEYLRVVEIAKQANKKPTVMSGAMYRDVWYMPQGDSWAAKFIEDANGDYLWKDSRGTGSLSMSLETVLEKGQNADFWIGPGQFISKEQFESDNQVYGEFIALQNGNVYTFTAKKGATGGVLYYELAPNRPDLVLKDIVKILHPDLLPDHELYFFSKVE